MNDNRKAVTIDGRRYAAWKCGGGDILVHLPVSPLSLPDEWGDVLAQSTPPTYVLLRGTAIYPVEVPEPVGWL